MRIIKQLAFTGLALAAASAVLATPIKRNDVAPHPLWLVHVDCDALRSTQFGQYLLAEMQKPLADSSFGGLGTIFGPDVRRNLRALTFYNARSDPEGGVLILYADFDQRRLVALLKTAKQYETSSHNKHTIHSWVEAKKSGQRVYAALYGSKIIIGRLSAAVAAALDNIDGGNTLQTSGAFPQFTGSTGPFCVQAAAGKLELPETNWLSAILKHCKGIRFDLSEMQQSVSARLVLEAGSEEVAGRLASVAKGFLAVIRLQTMHPDAAKLADTATLKQQDRSVTCQCQLSSADAIELIKAANARRAARNR